MNAAAGEEKKQAHDKAVAQVDEYLAEIDAVLEANEGVTCSSSSRRLSLAK